MLYVIVLSVSIFIAMLSVIMLSSIMLSAFMLSVIIPSVIMPFCWVSWRQTINSMLQLQGFESGEKRFTEGKAQYSPCTNQFRSVPFYIEKIIDIFMEQPNL